MLLKINHETRYQYSVPAKYALQQLRIRPQSNAGQTVHDWKVRLEGATLQTSFSDEHENLVDLLELQSDEKEVGIIVSGEVETTNTTGIVGPHSRMMPLWFYLRQTKLTQPGAQITSLVEGIAKGSRADVAFLHELSERILERVIYRSGETGIATSAEAAMTQGAGVCQDHTHIFLSAARALGIPARYVSGYLMMNDRVDQDASHAWAEAHVDGLGWVGFDVSNAISPDERYVQIARGLDYRGAAPTSGFVVGGEREKLVVSVQVQQ